MTWLNNRPNSRFSAPQNSPQEEHATGSFWAVTTENITANIPFKVGGESAKQIGLPTLFLILTQGLITWFIIFIRLSHWHCALFKTSPPLQWISTVGHAPISSTDWCLPYPMGLGWKLSILHLPWPIKAAHPSVHSDWSKKKAHDPSWANPSSCMRFAFCTGMGEDCSLYKFVNLLWEPHPPRTAGGHLISHEEQTPENEANTGSGAERRKENWALIIGFEPLDSAVPDAPTPVLCSCVSQYIHF